MKKLTFDDCKVFLDRFVGSLVSKPGNHVLSVALFGSIARGKGTVESDVDLVIVYEDERKSVERSAVEAILDIRESAEYRKLENEGFYLEICPVFISVGRLKEHPWILLDVSDQGIILFDRNDTLERELAKIRERLRILGSRKVTLPDGTWYWNLKPDLKPGEEFEI